MRALLLPLALLAGVAAVAVPAAALPVDCSGPPAPWLACHRFWAEVDAGYCLRQDEPAACLQGEDFSCTLDAPPSRCGNHIVGFGFRGAGV